MYTEQAVFLLFIIIGSLLKLSVILALVSFVVKYFDLLRSEGFFSLQERGLYHSRYASKRQSEENDVEIKNTEDSHDITMDKDKPTQPREKESTDSRNNRGDSALSAPGISCFSF